VLYAMHGCRFSFTRDYLEEASRPCTIKEQHTLQVLETCTCPLPTQLSLQSSCAVRLLPCVALGLDSACREPTTAVVATRCLPLNSSVVIAGSFTMVEEQRHHPCRGLGSRSLAEVAGRAAVKPAACGSRAWDEAVCGSSCEGSPDRLGWHIPLLMFSLLAGLNSHLHWTSAGQPLQ